MKNDFSIRWIFTLMAATVSAISSPAAPRSATFEARHELKVVVPDGAKRVRIWFAMPQDTSRSFHPHPLHAEAA